MSNYQRVSCRVFRSTKQQKSTAAGGFSIAGNSTCWLQSLLQCLAQQETHNVKPRDTCENSGKTGDWKLLLSEDFSVSLFEPIANVIIKLGIVGADLRVSQSIEFIPESSQIWTKSERNSELKGCYKKNTTICLILYRSIHFVGPYIFVIYGVINIWYMNHMIIHMSQNHTKRHFFAC